MAQPPRAFLDEPVDPEGGEGRGGEGAPPGSSDVCVRHGSARPEGPWLKAR